MADFSTDPDAAPPDHFDTPRAPAGRSSARGGKPAAQRGHGTTWIVTYSDMVTLLMAFFIAIITFSSRPSGADRNPRARDSLVEGLGGSGALGPVQKANTPNDAVIWRPRFRQGPMAENGAEFAPLYRDPAAQTSADILKALTGTPPGKIGDAYAIQLPYALFLTDRGKLTPSGAHVLQALAANLRDMPYDFQFAVGSAEQVAGAIQLCSFLSLRGGMHPSRLAVGVGPEKAPGTIALLLTPQM